MSKIGLSARLAAILDTAERINPMAARVHRLPPALRIRYDNWRSECDRLHDEIEREHESGASYAAYLDGKFATPEPPRAVAGALGLLAVPVLLESMTLREVAAIYAVMVDG